MRSRWLRAAVVSMLGLCALAAVAAPGDEGGMRRHADQVGTWTLLVEQVIGPLPAVASTPFFGLALLSGVGLVTDVGFVKDTRWGWLQGVRDNAIVVEARRYSTWPRLLVLCALALVGYLANSGKLQGLAGKAFRVFEDSSVMVGYTLLAIAALPDAAPAPAVIQAGLGAEWLIPVATGLALAAMMAVRFAFDVLIWLSPFPFVDLLFETLKKVATIGVLLLYATSPALSALLCLVVLVATGLVAGWAFRVLELYRRVIVNPVLGHFVPAFFPRALDEAAARACGLDPRSLSLASPAVALKLPGLPARSGGLLVAGDGFVRFVARGLRRRSTHELGRGPGERFHIGRSLLWIELRVVDDRGIVARFALSRALEPAYERIRDATRAADLGGLGALGLIETAGEVAGRKLAEAEDRLR
jgi:hypothetical protein